MTSASSAGLPTSTSPAMLAVEPPTQACSMRSQDAGKGHEGAIDSYTSRVLTLELLRPEPLVTMTSASSAGLPTSTPPAMLAAEPPTQVCSMRGQDAGEEMIQEMGMQE